MDIRNTIQRLLGHAPGPEDGVAESELNQASLRLGMPLPCSLLEFYRLAGNSPMLMSSFNSFARPEELEIDDGKIIFLEENQGVCHWGFAGGPDSPQVFMRPAESRDWHPEAPLDEFLPVVLYYQCAQGGYEFGGTVGLDDDSLRERIKKDWENVVDHNGFVAAWKPDCLLWHLLDDEGEIVDDLIYFSARTRQAYDAHESEYDLAEL